MDAEAEAQRGRLTCFRSHSTLTAESDTGIQPAGPLTSGLSLSYMSPLFVCWLFPPSQSLGSEEAVPGPSVVPSGDPGVSGDFWGLMGLYSIARKTYNSLSDDVECND